MINSLLKTSNLNNGFPLGKETNGVKNSNNQEINKAVSTSSDKKSIIKEEPFTFNLDKLKGLKVSKRDVDKNDANEEISNEKVDKKEVKKSTKKVLKKDAESKGVTKKKKVTKKEVKKVIKKTTKAKTTEKVKKETKKKAKEVKKTKKARNC